MALRGTLQKFGADHPTMAIIIVMGLFFLNTLLGAIAIYKVDQVSKRNHEAICSFRDDLVRRVRSSNEFLAAHPGPNPFPGVSRQTILVQITQEERTIASLSDAGCTTG